MTREIITHSRAGGKACGLGVQYSICNAQLCDPKTMELNVEKMAQKLEKTKLDVADATKKSAEQLKQTVELKKNETQAVATEKATFAKLQNLKAALSSAQTKNSKLTTDLKKVKKARFPAMHKIIHLSAIAGTLTGQARLDVLTEIRQLSKSAAKATSTTEADNDVAKARDELKLSTAKVTEIKKSIPLEQANLEAVKKKTNAAERSVKRSEWTERTQKHVKAKSTEWIDWEAKQLKKLKAQVNEMGEDLGEKKNQTLAPPMVPNSSNATKAKTAPGQENPMVATQKRAKSALKLVKINLHATQQDAAKAASKEGPAKAAVRAVEAKYAVAAKAANDTNITEALQRDLDNAQQDEERAEISSKIAKTQKSIVDSYERLKAILSDCVEDTSMPRAACAGVEKAQAAARSEVSEMRQEVEADRLTIVASYRMKCGDGKYQNENGEQCDDGNVRSGDGCDKDCKIEKGWSCAAGSWNHASGCDKCGNGHTRAGEECDDGNTDNDDGCSADCKIEERYACSVDAVSGASTCQDLGEKEQGTMSKLRIKQISCSKSGGFFMAPATGGEQCVDKANVVAAGNAVNTPEEETLADVSGSRVIGGAVLRLTCPMPLDTANTNGKTGATPFAVCSENKYETCETTAGASRKCKFRKVVACEEVCVAARFCESAELPAGALVKRQYSAAHTPTGRACCFKHCKVPSSWTSNGKPIDPTAWCLPIAHEV